MRIWINGWIEKGLVEELTKMRGGSVPLAACTTQIRGRNEIHRVRLKRRKLDKKKPGKSVRIFFLCVCVCGSC